MQFIVASLEPVETLNELVLIVDASSWIHTEAARHSSSDSIVSTQAGSSRLRVKFPHVKLYFIFLCLACVVYLVGQ